jgi:hypothetical protein
VVKDHDQRRSIENKLKEKIMKFEMAIGYIENEKITVETWDFDKIEIIKDFIDFQEEHGWAVDYEATEPLDFEDEEEEETSPFALDSKEEL